MKHRVLVNGLCLACILLAGLCGSLSAGVNLNVDGTLSWQDCAAASLPAST